MVLAVFSLSCSSAEQLLSEWHQSEDQRITELVWLEESFKIKSSCFPKWAPDGTSHGEQIKPSYLQEHCR